LSRILVVEDDADVRFIVEHILLEAGYEVDAAGTMNGGAELLGRRRYDLVLADGKLPDGTGLDIADMAVGKGIKALIVTGYAFTLPPDANRHEILLKPLRPREIVDAVERALAAD